MALFNYVNREITAKVVYYGPGVCGKTTSLQYIHERIAPAQRGRLLSLATETDRTIFFDLLPLKLGEIGGFKLRFQLYTVPGQVKYNKTRKLVLKGADAVVFVADSQVSRREANIESFQNLKENLKEQSRDLKELPLVYAYNKRDLENVLPVEDLNADLNSDNLPYFPAVAIKGVGVMETLEAISKIALQDIETRLTTKAPSETTAEEEFTMAEEEEVGKGDILDTSLTFSTEELDALTLESDLDISGDGEKHLETRPIGYDTDIPIQEIEIQDEDIAHTGTLKESEFFNLKDIEEQALRELDSFIEGKTDEESLEEAEEKTSPPEKQEEPEEESFEFALVDNPDAEESNRFDGGGLDFSFSAAVPEEPEELGEDEGEETLDLGVPESDVELGLHLEDDTQAIQTEKEEPELTFSLDEDSEEETLSLDEGPEEETLSLEPEDIPSGEDVLTFDLEEESSPLLIPTEEEPQSAPFPPEQDESMDLSLDEELPEPVSEQPVQESQTKAEIESLDLSDSDLEFALDEEESKEQEKSLAFTLPEEEDLRGESTPLTGDEDELEFSLGEEAETAELEQAPSEKTEIESLDFSDSDLEMALSEEEETGEGEEASFEGFEASEESPDFMITDSVKFEMQHSEEISSVTPFEKQLDELSEDIFTAEEETAGDEFQPETSEGREEEAFQTVPDTITRLTILAKYFYQQGETYRKKQTVSDNILAIFTYYAAIETMLKAAASKYDSCNPAIASLPIVLDSIEEETDKTITGKNSLMDNIVTIKNEIQLETIYPDDEGCELAARICERFLTTFSQDFLSIDFTELSPLLANPADD